MPKNSVPGVYTVQPPSFVRRHSRQLIGLALWAVLIGSYAYYVTSRQLTLEKIVNQWLYILTSTYGPLLYILFFAITPLLFFFSAATLAIIGGSVFGAGSLVNLALAILYTAIGSQAAALVAYLLGRTLGIGLIPEDNKFVQGYTDWMRQNGFESVLIMHALFLPYELVNYLAGILRVHWFSFLLATLLGSLPGMLTFVSFGAAIDLKELALGNRPHLDLTLILFSLGVLAISLLGARYLRRYQR